jgi:O-antigen/teichoic acid export membrane protein
MRDWLMRGGFRQHAAVMFASTVLARALFFVSMPLISRCFSPADIGHWQLFVSIATVAGAIICWRYEVAIPLPATREQSRDLVAICRFLAIGMSALIVVPIVLFRDPFSDFIGSAELRPFLWCIPVFTFFFGCEQASTFWLTRTGEFVSIGASRLMKSALTVLVPLSVCSFSEARCGYLIAGTLLAQLVASAYLLRIDSQNNDVWEFDRQRLHRFRQVMFEYRNYPIYVAPYAFIGQFCKRLIYFLLAGFATASTVGYFAMAMQITYLPATLITSALNQAFYRRACAEANFSNLQPLVLKILRIQVILAVPLFAIVGMHSKGLLVLLLGKSWSEAAGFVSCLAAPSMMLFFTAWLDRLFDSLGRQRLAVGMQVAYDAVSIGVLFGCLASGQSPLFAIAAYCLVTTAYNILWLCVAFTIAGFSLPALIRLMLSAALLALFMFVANMVLTAYLRQPIALCIELATVAIVQYHSIRNFKGLLQ